jgi:hypothetical protein
MLDPMHDVPPSRSLQDYREEGDAEVMAALTSRVRYSRDRFYAISPRSLPAAPMSTFST